jgi:hypothetical protein
MFPSLRPFDCEIADISTGSAITYFLLIYLIYRPYILYYGTSVSNVKKELMVQISQIPGNIDLRLHIGGWQPQIQRIWGWLRCFWSFTIPNPFDFAQGSAALEAATRD